MTEKPLDPESPRVLRGGCWYFSFAAPVRAAYRFRGAPSGRGSYVGFRTRLSGRSPRT